MRFHCIFIQRNLRRIYPEIFFNSWKILRLLRLKYAPRITLKVFSAISTKAPQRVSLCFLRIFCRSFSKISSKEKFQKFLQEISARFLLEFHPGFLLGFLPEFLHELLLRTSVRFFHDFSRDSFQNCPQKIPSGDAPRDVSQCFSGFILDFFPRFFSRSSILGFILELWITNVGILSVISMEGFSS